MAIAVFGDADARLRDPYAYRDIVVSKSNPIRVHGGVFDFGKDAFGWLELVDAGRGDYEIRIGEMTNSVGRVDNPWPGSTIRFQRLMGKVDSDHFRVPMTPDERNTQGSNHRAVPILMPKWAGVVLPFRFVEVVKAPTKISSKNLVRKVVHHPIDMAKSSFVCDNETLNDVYEFCKYTIWATSFSGFYVDGDRERIPYEADAYINQLGHYSIDDDYTMARRTCEWLMDHPTWPTEWKQHQIKIQWADWMWTGDVRSMAKFWPLLKTEKLLVDYARKQDGLLLTGGEQGKGCLIPKGGDIVDWPPTERDGFEMRPVNGVVNAFYYRNLIELSQMAGGLGRIDESRNLMARAATIRQAFRRVFLSPETGVFVDGEGSTHSSLHVNAASLAFGLADPDEYLRIVSFLEGRGMACSVYFAQYLLDAFCNVGRADLAVRLMTSSGPRSWKGMMDFGSTLSLEAWNVLAKPNLDLNHAWGTAPLNVIARHILGVTPAEPGFATIAVRPQMGGLKWMKGRVPTLRGVVGVCVKGNKLVVDTPTRTKVTWGGRVMTVDKGVHTFTSHEETCTD